LSLSSEAKVLDRGLASGWLQSAVTTTDGLVYQVPSLKRTSCPKRLHYNANHMLRCVFIVERGIAHFLCTMDVFEVHPHP